MNNINMLAVFIFVMAVSFININNVIEVKKNLGSVVIISSIPLKVS